MKIFQNLFSATSSQPDELSAHEKTFSKTFSKGPETVPVKMNLEERMEFRRELLFESVRSTFEEQGILPGSYRFKVMRTDKRGHCYAIMADMSPAFMHSAQGRHKRLAEVAALLTQNARVRYGLVVAGMYWRVDETLDAAVATWARPPGIPAPPVGPAFVPADTALGTIDKNQQATQDQLAAFEAEWQKSNDIRIGNRTYSSDLAPLGDDAVRR